MPPKIQLAGRRFGRLVVLEESGRDHKNRITWRCLCDCGEETSVLGSRLRIDHTTSCGCVQRERNQKFGDLMLDKHVTHGLSRTPTHKSWDAMMQRCTNTNHEAYGRYGGAGIGVCERWSTSFETFAEDMGIRPEGTTLERIDNDLGYEPENCRWATWVEQGRHRSSVKLTEIDADQIRWLYIDGGFKQWQIAYAFNIQQPQVSRVVNRKRWAICVENM